MRKLRIAMIGQKGIPARYGGVETHVEKIAVRLAAMGNEVSVYCRSRLKPSSIGEEGGATVDVGLERGKDGWRYKGVKLLFRPSINTKHLDAATHCFLCALDAALVQNFDVVHLHGIGPSAFAFIPRIAGTKVVSTMHALDWRQVKWQGIAERAMKRGEKMGATKSHGVITVSRIISEYMSREYGIEATYIPNGAELVTPRPPRSIERFDLAGDDYILTVGRIIPERGLHDLVHAFTEIDTPIKLVIVGSEMPPTDYSSRLFEMADDRVIFTGNQYGEMLEELYSNCRLYVLASSVEGLPITVCEAMAYSRGILLSDIPENREVAGDAARFYKQGDINELRDTLKALLEDNEALLELGQRGKKRVETEYNWDKITASVAECYQRVVAT